jgi:DNA-binding transcriptional LysR family regulator
VDLQQLRYFLAVVHHGTISAAANAVGVAQPTMSQGLRALERELRTPLFYRIGRGMVPTAAGHALAGPARTILRDSSTAAGSVPDSEGQLHGRVDIRAHPAVITGLLPRIIAEFRSRNPKALVSVAAMYDESEASTLLADAVCEVVIAHLPLASGRSDEPALVAGKSMTTVTLAAQTYDLALPPGHDGPQESSMAWDELDAAMVVVPQGTSHAQRMFEWMSPRQQARRPAVVLQNREARLAFALAGVGATWIEHSLRVRALQRGAAIRTMTPPLTANYGLAFVEDSLSPCARAFVDLAVEMTADELTADPASQVPDASVANRPAAAGES